MRTQRLLYVLLFVFAPTAQADELTFRMLIQFSVNSAKVEPKYDEQLKWMARFMKKFPNSTVEIHGHADSSGNKAKNLKLSWDRAEAVRAAIISRHGVAARRLTAQGHGDASPDADPKNRAASRRVTMAVAKDAPGAFKGLKKEIVIYDTPEVTFEDPKYQAVPVAAAPPPVREVASPAPVQTAVVTLDRARARCPMTDKTCTNQFAFGLFGAHHASRVTQFVSGSVISVSFGWNPQWYRSQNFTVGTRLGQFLLHDQDGGNFVALEGGILFGYDVAKDWAIIAGPLCGYWTQSEVKGFSPGVSFGTEWFLGMDTALPKIGLEYAFWRQRVANVHLVRLNFGVAL